jgi:hypothetical protein
MVAKLVTVGDSLTQGFQHLAIRRPEWSYPAMLARALGAEFRQADFSGGGHGGPLTDLELLFQEISRRAGAKLSWWEWPEAGLTVQTFMDVVEDYWERGAGTRSSRTGPLHHNLAVWGFEVLDALTLSDGVCLRNTHPPRSDALNQIPEFGMYRTARRVFNPHQLPDLEELPQLDLAQRIARDEGPIENLIVALGANNVLGTCARLKLNWSQSADIRKLGHQRSCTIWEPAHFRSIYAALAGKIAAVPAQRKFVATVPHVTVAPVTRGVSPRAKARGSDPLFDKYYEYYTRFWLWDADFNPDVHDHLTREDAARIDRVIDEYNEVIVEAAVANGFHVIDLCALLDSLAFRRNRGRPSYRFPEGLKRALAGNAATAQRVRPDGTVLLDTRYLRVPLEDPAADAASEKWQEAYRGGLFGLDGAHPTTIGYGVIAYEVLKVMQQAGTPGADPDQLAWPDIVAADSLVTSPPAVLSSLEQTLGFLFGKLSLDKAVEKLAGYGAEDF